MGNFLLDGLSIEMVPAITMWSLEDLGDDPAKHRWRAWWAQGDVANEVGGIELRAYPVMKTTPCGVWVNQHAWREWDKSWHVPSFGKRFVHNDSMQAWAKPTQDEAVKSIAIRLTRWSNRIAGDVRRAKSAADALEKLRLDLADFAQIARENLGDQP